MKARNCPDDYFQLHKHTLERAISKHSITDLTLLGMPFEAGCTSAARERVAARDRT